MLRAREKAPDRWQYAGKETLGAKDILTPEFVIEERGEYVLVANHGLEIAESLKLGVAYNLARIKFGSSHLPNQLQKCHVIYDIRGQSLADGTIDEIKKALEPNCTLAFKS